jgi:hypothetical protein
MRNDTACDPQCIGAHPSRRYPLAWPGELNTGGAYPTPFPDHPIVLMRPKDKPHFARKDRCDRRQVPVSTGAVHTCALVLKQSWRRFPLIGSDEGVH